MNNGYCEIYLPKIRHKMYIAKYSVFENTAYTYIHNYRINLIKYIYYLNKYFDNQIINILSTKNI